MSKSAPAKTPTAPPIRRRGNRIYTAIWVVLGLSAAAYLAILASGQHFPTDTITKLWQTTDEQPIVTATLRQSSENVETVKPAVNTSETVNQNWSRMANDIANLQAKITTVTSDVAQIRTVQNETDERLTTLEKWKTVAEAAPQSAQTVTQIQTSDSTIEGTTLDGVTRTAEPQPQPDAKPLQTNDQMVLAALLGDQDTPPQEAAPETNTAVTTPAPEAPKTATASAPKPAAAQPAPAIIRANVPIPGRRAFGIELATGDSVDSLRLSWALLNERHRDLIGRLAPRYIHSGAGTQNPFRLIAGPFKSSRSAKELCRRLQTYFVSCSTSAFTGSVL